MKIENVIDIAAPAAIVWAVTIDVERWPEWFPTALGATLQRLRVGRLLGKRDQAPRSSAKR